MKTTRSILTTDRVLTAGAEDVTDLATSIKLVIKDDEVLMVFDGAFRRRVIDMLIEYDEHCDDMIDYDERTRYEWTDDELIDIFTTAVKNGTI